MEQFSIGIFHKAYQHEGTRVNRREESSMNARLVCIILIVSTVSLGVFLPTAKAPSYPNLPSVPVTMNVVNGTASYYVATLSNVPDGYDVTNGTYDNWCVDRRYTTIRGTDIQVQLYSSLNPPPELEPQWDKVNYILNNKRGGRMDIQDAIWYFIKMGSFGWWPGATPSIISQDIVNDAWANGNGYVPRQGELLAVIAVPTTATQITIIETLIPVLPVGGYSHSAGQIVYGQLVPYLASLMILATVLVELRHKTRVKARKPKSTANESY